MGAVDSGPGGAGRSSGDPDLDLGAADVHPMSGEVPA